MNAPAPSASPSPTTSTDSSPPETGQSERASLPSGWSRPPEKRETSAQTERATPPQKSAPPAERKEKPTSEKPDKEAPKQAQPVDDDPEEEWEDERGQKFKAKKSEIRKRFARAAEIERESHARFQQGAEARKEIESLRAEYQQAVQALQQDPWAFNRAHLMRTEGLTAEQAEEKLNAIAEERLVKQMQRARMSPEEIEHERIVSENEQLRREKTEREEVEKKKRYEAARKLHRDEWDRAIGEAMVAAKLPKTRFAAARVAKVLADHLDPETGKSIDPTLAARIARDVHHTEIRHELSELAAANPQAAIELIGPELVKLIVKQSAKEHQEFVPQGGGAKPPPPPPKPKNTAPPTLEEARRRLGVRHF